MDHFHVNGKVCKECTVLPSFSCQGYMRKDNQEGKALATQRKLRGMIFDTLDIFI